MIHTFSWQEKGRWVKPEPQFPCEVASGRESSVNLQNQTTCCETFYGRGSAELALNFSQSDRKHWKEPKQVNRQVKNCHRQLQPGTSANSSPWTGPLDLVCTVGAFLMTSSDQLYGFCEVTVVTMKSEWKSRTLFGSDSALISRYLWCERVSHVS